MRHIDEQYVKVLEKAIECQQVRVDKYGEFIKRLDKLNIKMSMQECSQFIQPEAFVKWLESGNTWSVVHSSENADGTTKTFQLNTKDARQVTLRTKYYIKSHRHLYLTGIIGAFSIVWDFWLRDHKGSGIISLIIEIMEFETNG